MENSLEQQVVKIVQNVLKNTDPQLSRKDYFAGQALKALITKGDSISDWTKKYGYKKVSEDEINEVMDGHIYTAHLYADLMIKELEKEISR